MRAEDLREMSRRLEEIIFIAERGYEPVQASGVPLLWVKCHAGKVLSHQKALEEIASDEELIPEAYEVLWDTVPELRAAQDASEATDRPECGRQLRFGEGEGPR